MKSHPTMEPGSVMILAIVINACQRIDAKLNVIPRDTEVKINDSTYMNCSTSLQADLVQWRHGNNYVYTGIAILEPYIDGRFSVEINTSTGASNLVIRSVQPSDAGKFECVEDEGFGEIRSAQLIVLDDDPNCESTMHSDGVIGPNSCSIEPDVVQLSCSVAYQGSTPPILQWKANGDNQSITNGLFNTTSINNEVTYTLQMKGALDLDNSSFICQTTRTSDKHYSCSSNTISILYIFSSEVTINMTMNDEVSCFANTSQSCDYKWKWFNGDDSTTESDNQILKPKKVGMHRCEATCSIGNQSCTVESMHAKVYRDATSSFQNRLPLLALLLVGLPAVALLGVVIYRRRKRKIGKTTHETEKQELQRQTILDGLPEKYKSDPVLVDTIKTKPATDANKSIFGLTILDNELFVVSERSSEVEVYDSIKFSFKRGLNLKKLIDPWDIESCNRNKCLYIFDYKGHEKLNEIFRVHPNGELLKNWSTGYDCGWGLSVTDESNVILTVSKKNKLNEYSPDGQLVREIHLSLYAGICNPLHAIKLTNGNFVISHGDAGDALHRVCIVDVDGKLKKSFGGIPGSNIGQLNGPFHLNVDGDGFVLVTDRENHRVLLLDSDLKFKRELLSTEKHELRRPMRTLLDESNGRMLVADNKWGCEGRILIVKLCV